MAVIIYERKYINALIVNNAASLQVLVTFDNLPSSRQGPVVYPAIEETEMLFHGFGNRMPGSGRPDDQSLLLTGTSGSAADPDDAQVRVSLRDPHLNFAMIHDVNDEVQHVPRKAFQAAKRLVHLTHLTIYFSFYSDYDVPVDDLSTLMDNFTSLVHLELVLPVTDFDFDQKVVLLVRQNPGLRHLELFDFDLSDIALTSIGRLRDLRHVKLDGRKSRFTVNGLLTLFRSPLRSLLLFAGFVVCGTTDDEKDEITGEIDLLAAERGKPFEANKHEFLDTYTFSFKLKD